VPQRVHGGRGAIDGAPALPSALGGRERSRERVGREEKGKGRRDRGGERNRY